MFEGATKSNLRRIHSMEYKCVEYSKWLVDFNAGKTQLVSSDRSNNTGGIDVNMDGSFLEKKSSFKILG